MSDQAFWRYSLDRYGRDGVPAICLLLQAEHGADVNIVLFALWTAQQGYVLQPEDAAVCVATVEDWHRSVVMPMRSVRCWLKDREVLDTEARDRLRAEVQKWEIEAERMEQDMLYSLTTDGTLSLKMEAGSVEAIMVSNVATVCTAPAALLERLVALCV